jgi:hypothetical protein
MEPKRQPVTRIDYCQYLLISQINYTLTNFADHTEHFSHDAVNRYLAGDSGGGASYQRVDALAWSESARTHGKVVKIKGFPKEHKVKLFRVVLSPQRTDYVVTNDLTQDDTQAAQEACGWRWKIEQFLRETKQLTGLEGCQCRKARIVRNHIGCAILVWVRLKQVAVETNQTIYKVKHGLLSDYVRQQLKSPAVAMRLA